MAGEGDLQFDLAFGGVNVDSIVAAWKANEAKIQSEINRISNITVPVDAASVKGLNESLKTTQQALERINKLQSGATGGKLSAYRSGQLDIQREAAAKVANAKADVENARSAKINQSAKLQLEAATRKQEAATLRATKATNGHTSAWKTQGFALNGVKQTLGAYASVLGAMRLVDNIRQITGEFELQKVALRAITQDAIFADQLFEKIKATAIESPFSTMDLVTYTKQLAAFNIPNNELFDTMNKLADVSAGLGVDMSRLILAYGQVGAASVLRGQELRQFTEAGIPLVQLLADKFTKLNGTLTSTGDVFELISKRAVPFEMIKEIFTSMTSEGGKFYEMQKIQAESLSGIYANLSDNIQIAFNELGTANREIFADVGLGATYLAQNLVAVVDVITDVAIGFGIWRLAIMANNAALGKEAAELTKTVLLNKAKEASLLRQASVYRTLTSEEELAIVTSGKLTTANLLELATSGKLTKEMVLRMVATRKITAAQAMRLSTTLDITKAEIAQAAATTLAGRAYLAFGSAIQKVGLAMKSLFVTMLTNPTTWIFAAIAGIVKWTTAISDHSKKTREDYNNAKKNLRDYSDQVTQSYNDVKGVIEKGLSFKVDTAEVTDAIKALQSLVGENAGLYSLLMQGTDGDKTQVENLKLMAENWQNIKVGIDAAANSMFLLSDAVNAIGGRWWALSFNETVEANIEDVVGNIDDVRQSLVELSRDNQWDVGIGSSFKEFSKEGRTFDETLQFAEESLRKITKMFKGREMSSYYQDLANQLNDLKSDARTAKAQFAELDEHIASNFKGVDWSKATVAQKAQLQKMKDAWDATNTDMSEAGRKIWDAYFAKTYYLKVEIPALPKKELSKEIQDLNEELDRLGLSSSKITKVGTTMSEAAQQLGGEYEKALAEYDRMVVSFGQGNKKVTQKAIDDQKVLSDNLLKAANYAGYAKKQVAGEGGGRGDNRLSLLNEEVSQVEKVYQAYKKLTEQIGAEGARKEIERLFGTLDKATGKMKVTGTRFDIAKTAKEMSDAYKLASDYASKLPKSEKPVMELNFKASQTSWDALSEEVKNKLAKLQSEIEKQQKANDFFETMLGITRDRQLAADITVGIYGAGFEDTANMIKQQLTTAFAGVDVSLELGGDVIDYTGLLAKLNQLEKVAGKNARDIAEKFVRDGINTNALMVQELYKSLADYTSYQTKRIKIAREAAEKIAFINKTTSIPEEDKSQLKEDVRRQEGKQYAKLSFDEFKESDLYVTMFEKLDQVSTATLKTLKQNLEGLKIAENLDPNDLKVVVGKIQEIDTQLDVRNPFKTLVEAAKAYRKEIQDMPLPQREEKLLASAQKREVSKTELDAAVEEMVLQEQKLELVKAEFGVNSQQARGQSAILAIATSRVALADRQLKLDEKDVKANKDNVEVVTDLRTKMINAIDGVSGEEGVRDVIGGLKDATDGIKKLGETFGAGEGFSMAMDSIGEVLEGLDKMGEGVSDVLKGKTFSGVGKIIGGLADGIAGIFGAAYIKRIQAANKEIEKQEKILEDLDKAYAKLQKAESKALGEDYVANQRDQVANAQAKADAIYKQWQAELSKGKKMDKEQAAAFEKAWKDAQEVADEVATETPRKITETMLGADLTSTAQQFASAWLDAYIAIGGQGAITTDEMKEQWKGMMKNMVANSLIARAVQAALEPVFTMIDESFKDEQYPTPQKINEIINAGNAAIEGLGVSLPKLLEGLDLSKLGAAAETGLTGISKNIAQASEDQITGLAAGINTQNSYFAQTVVLTTGIYTLMHKWDLEKTSEGSITTSQLIGIQTSALVQLRAINTNTMNTVGELQQIKEELRSVIRPRGVAATKVIKTELV